MRLTRREMVIDLGRIESLRGIRDDGDPIVIGAMTTYHEVRDDLVREHAAADHKAAEVADPRCATAGPSAAPWRTPTRPVTSVPRRSRSTPRSSCRAPAAPAPSRRRGSSSTYFTTAIGEGEILTEIRIPRGTGWGSHYEKFVRTAQWSDRRHRRRGRRRGRHHREARVGLTNMGSTPLRATAVEQALVGQQATDEAVRQPRRRPAEGTNPPTTSTATPTTAGTSPPCSPDARSFAAAGG